MNQNIGHGHVRLRPDGVKVRCGGPGLCNECSKEQCLINKEILISRWTAKSKYICHKCSKKKVDSTGLCLSCGETFKLVMNVTAL